MADNDDFGSFLSGFIIGGLVGAAVSLMMAPQSGAETRQQLRSKGVELRDRAEDELGDIRDRAERTLADVRTQTDDMQRKAMMMMDEAKAKVDEAARRVRNDASDAAGELSSGNKPVG